MTFAAFIIVIERWLEAGTRGARSDADQFLRAYDGERLAVWLDEVGADMPPGEAERMLGQLADGLRATSTHSWMCPSQPTAWMRPAECRAWCERLRTLATMGTAALGDYEFELPPFRGIRPFWIACEYRLRIASGEPWKIARGHVADAWRRKDSVVSTYASREAANVCRLLVATVRENSSLHAALAEVQRASRRNRAA